MKKAVSLRSAVIIGSALAAGSSVGGVAEVLLALLRQPVPGAGHVAAAAATLWFAEKLDRVIDDEDTVR